MTKLITNTAFIAALTLVAPHAGFAAGHTGGGGARGGGSRSSGSAGGAARGGTAMHSGSPRAPGSRAGGSAGTAVPRPHGRGVPPYGGTARSPWPYYGIAGGGLFGFGLGGYYDPSWDLDSSDAYPYADALPAPPAPDEPEPFAVTGGLRLDVAPRSAEVFVDGGVAGVVSDFSGHFRHLTLPAGAHHVEIAAPGHASVQFDVNIEPHHTINYHGKLART